MVSHSAGGEPPVVALATVIQVRSERACLLHLPNGKPTHGHVPRRFANAVLPLAAGDMVSVELSPYNFDQARITAKVNSK